MVINPIDWPYFYFIVVVVSLDIGGATGLAIVGAVLIGVKVAIGFFGLFLW